MKEAKPIKLEKIVFYSTLIGLILLVNCMFFFNWLPKFKGDSPEIKVEEIGNTVLLSYASSNEEYLIQGIESNNKFVRKNGLYVFYNSDYCVSKNGTSYNIVTPSGKVVGSVNLIRSSEIVHNTLEIDAATYTNKILKVPATCTQLRVYTSASGAEQPISIQIEDRDTSLDVIFDNVSLKAPDMCPVLYSLNDAPVNLTVQGSVSVIGGKNTYNAADISGKDRFLNTLDTAANAYCVVMISAIGGAASIYKGAEYYAEMFKGITSLQLITMDNAWGKVENLFNGEDGATGLDGIPAIQIQGDLNIAGNRESFLYICGGQGARGGNGLGGFINTTRGGTGGNGASGLICNRLINGINYNLTIEAGSGGEGGDGGKNIVGEQGSSGNYGRSQENKVIISKTEIALDF